MGAKEWLDMEVQRERYGLTEKGSVAARQIAMTRATVSERRRMRQAMVATWQRSESLRTHSLS